MTWAGILKWLLVAILLLAVLVALYVRLAPSDAARWHVDPLIAPDPTTPNFARVDRVVGLPTYAVEAYLNGRAQGDGAQILQRDATTTTWVVRSLLMGYPDYVTIRLIPVGSQTRIVAFSRSRFGHGDWGVNAARLARWLPE